jgi:hypothetical protein
MHQQNVTDLAGCVGFVGLEVHVDGGTIMGVMAVTVRRMTSRDARRFLEIHRAAVRGIAAKDSPSGGRINFTCL